MQIIRTVLSSGFSNELFRLFRLRDGDVFFDIETTGLAWRRSHLYLIGAVYFDESTASLCLIQWFLDRPTEEKKLLMQFSEFLLGHKRLIHYNGDGFDLPYLIAKYNDYQLENPIESMESYDLYRILRPFGRFFQLSSMKQKDLEQFLSVPRKDPYSGGELIPVYHQYLLNGSQTALHDLLRHNREDLLGMLRITELLSYPAFFSGDFSVEKAIYTDEGLSLQLTPSIPFPLELERKNTLCSLLTQSQTALLTIPTYRGILKYFFPDYRNYYYLPMEDQAIHKSIGAYVDPTHREKARPSNCYQKRKGIFLPEPEPVFTPAFRENHKSMPLFFEWSDSIASDRDILTVYAQHMIESLKKNSGT